MSRGEVLTPEQEASVRRGQAALVKVTDERLEELKREMRKSPRDPKIWETMMSHRRFRASILGETPEPIRGEPPARLGIRWLY
jgi:hypothetical protein